MPRTRSHLPPEEAAALQAHELHEQDGSTRTRMQAVRLYGMGKPSRPEIITGISRSRLLEWYCAYRRDGLAALLDHRTGGNNRKLTEAQIADLTTRLPTVYPAQSLWAGGGHADRPILVAD